MRREDPAPGRRDDTDRKRDDIKRTGHKLRDSKQRTSE